MLYTADDADSDAMNSALSASPRLEPGRTPHDHISNLKRPEGTCKTDKADTDEQSPTGGCREYRGSVEFDRIRRPTQTEPRYAMYAGAVEGGAAGTTVESAARRTGPCLP